MDNPKPQGRRGPLPVVTSEDEILGLALEAAARSGDPEPELVQHTTGTREATTKTTGSWVRSEEPSYLIAMRGRFVRSRPRPHRLQGDEADDALEPYPVQVLVVEIESGRVTDSGSGFNWPDLASVGAVVTDWRRSP